MVKYNAQHLVQGLCTSKMFQNKLPVFVSRVTVALTTVTFISIVNVQNDKIKRSAFIVERGRGTHFGVVDSEFFSI